MDYYQSDQPPQVDPKNLSGGVAFQFNGAIAAGGTKSSSQTRPPKQPAIVTLQICVDGQTKSLDVWANGQPY